MSRGLGDVYKRQKELFRVIMTGYRENDTAKAEPLEEEDLLELL